MTRFGFTAMPALISSPAIDESLSALHSKKGWAA